MDVSNVMNTYNLSSLWSDLNSSNSVTTIVPLVDNVDAAVKENYTSMNYSGQTTSTELQNIYQQVEPDYGTSLTYNQNGNMSIPTITTLPTNGLNTVDSNVISLLNSGNTSSENSLINILSQYNSIQDGTFQTDISSILSNNPSNLYSYIDSLGNNETQVWGNNVDSIV